MSSINVLQGQKTFTTDTKLPHTSSLAMLVSRMLLKINF